ncbi:MULTISPECIES: co-chaperone YbbN [unclassified Nocardioides]|uniref:co-chaperone YbbN n=1 Tax=unclassified Nocardioides TaxID=2615069 RepID=UPI00114E9C0E|nr:MULTISPECIES: tetratricopeptide repeat protein [unclassified Nocardioides]TQK72019.1 putative thioredoxin [Nocardioides sp. SLBN-35]WGY03792.1 tetratricopeptide repeat protein [Nocardioides sp. QY071]
MTQQPFSRPGAIDLSALKRTPPAGAGAGGAAGAPTGGGGAGGSTSAYSVAVDETNFQAVLEASMTAPVVLVFSSPSQSPESAQLALDVATVADEYDGRFLAATIDVDVVPQIAQAMQVPQVPLMLVLLDGRPATQPIPGAAPIDDIRALFNQLAQQLTAQGISGRHQPNAFGAAGGEVAEGEEPAIDPRYVPAQDALEAGDIDAAVAEYQKLVDANPADHEAAAGLAMAKVLQRTQGVDLNAARAAAAANPDDVDAQTMVADMDMLGGHVEDAFARLVELVRRTSGKERDLAREHLVGLFGAVGNDDPRVLKGRQALASALF